MGAVHSFGFFRKIHIFPKIGEWFILGPKLTLLSSLKIGSLGFSQNCKWIAGINEGAEQPVTCQIRKSW